MEKRLFFNRIHVLGYNFIMDKAVKPALRVLTHCANASVAFRNATFMRAEMAYNSLVINGLKKESFFHYVLHM